MRSCTQEQTVISAHVFSECSQTNNLRPGRSQGCDRPINLRRDVGGRRENGVRSRRSWSRIRDWEWKSRGGLLDRRRGGRCGWRCDIRGGREGGDVRGRTVLQGTRRLLSWRRRSTRLLGWRRREGRSRLSLRRNRSRDRRDRGEWSLGGRLVRLIERRRGKDRFHWS